MADKKLLLAERAMALGGSDVHQLLTLKPYGCVRRLWYEKKGVTADEPFVGNAHTARGEALEHIALEQYAAASGRCVRKPSSAESWRLKPNTRIMGVHADAFQADEGRRKSEGLVEVKCPSVFSYLKVRRLADPPNAAALQAQWGMMCWGMSWATVVAFCADMWTQRSWDIDADPKMAINLSLLAHEFWGTLFSNENPHPRLDRADARCSTCPWRRTCQQIRPEEDRQRLRPTEEEYAGGARRVVLDESAAPLIERYVRAEREAKDAKEALEIVKQEITDRFGGDPGLLETSAGTATITRVERKGYTAVVKPTSYLQLRVKPAEKEEDADVRYEFE